ncbi:hypothetical protein O6H91_01G067800 [Diphasiastrum complanatum]|nr:hypothetical protein O6H91_01G067800 [Diphasiastrum complanatum]
MRKTKTSSRYFQKPVMKKKTRLPPLAGPEGPGWCNICQTDCNTSEMLQYHVAGKKHKKKLQQLGKEGKDAVEKSSPAENLRQVLKNDKDATIVIESNSKFSLTDVTSAEKAGSCLGSRKLDNANIEEPSVEPPAKRPHLLEDPQSIQKLLLTERCDICNIACNTKMVLESHFKGKKHAAKVKKLADGAQFRKTGSHLKVQRNEIKEETVGKELNSGFVRDTEKGMNDNLTEDQCTKLKDIAVCLDGSTTSIRRDDDVIGNSDPQPGTEELASEKSKEH